jgi:hypothetical protein
MIRPNGNYAAFAGLIARATAEIAGIGRQDVPLAAE